MARRRQRDPDGLTAREARFLSLLLDEGATIQIGLRVAGELARRGYLTIAKYKRWGITQAGRDAYARHMNPPPAGQGTGPGNRAGTGKGTGNRKAPGAGAGAGQLTLF